MDETNFFPQFYTLFFIKKKKKTLLYSEMNPFPVPIYRAISFFLMAGYIILSWMDVSYLIAIYAVSMLLYRKISLVVEVISQKCM